ncbi:glutaredoxin family protein [Halobacillus salinarum]|uniref:Glutaredoxin family protein n=1 Tax=Halobacillus salinarum TaxID=2932257 RepID=A0ABY4EN28_9BACI|nr:glutaredoxin family protein [Halobacillus salinarum]UOQ45865.1 glutaredoxin family protein [Halobacillus salinarum]
MQTVYLMSREGCHLCEEVRALLSILELEKNVKVQEVNIENDEALLNQYMLEIPVVIIGDQELQYPAISLELLRERLQ